MKALVVHYKNKYPFGRVDASEDKLDVFCADGVHRVALRKGGDGQLRDVSKELGAVDGHDLSPIPKNSRIHKLNKDGTIGLDDQAEARFQTSKYMKVKNKILSLAEYQQDPAKWSVDEKGNVNLVKSQSDN